QLDPALLRAERLVRHQPKPQRLRIELQCAVLVCHRNADKLHSSNHRRLLHPTNILHFRIAARQAAMVMDTIVVCTIPRLTTTCWTSCCRTSPVRIDPRQHSSSISYSGHASTAPRSEASP